MCEIQTENILVRGQIANSTIMLWKLKTSGAHLTADLVTYSLFFETKHIDVFIEFDFNLCFETCLEGDL